MDEKYIVQFITLLGGACVSIVMAYRVYTEQVDVVYALFVLFFAVVLFFVLGRIVHRVMNKFNVENREREKKEREEARRLSEEKAAKDTAGEDETEAELELEEDN